MRNLDGITQEKSILKTMYLYEIEPQVLSNMNYKEAVELKLQRAKDLIKELIEPHYSIRDDIRINKVFEAIKYNEGILKELNDSVNITT